MQFLTPRIHGFLDYAAALALIAVPFIIGLADIALWLSVAAGVGLIVYSLITDYSASAAKLIPFRIHLILDGAAALAFIAAPFLMGWEGATMIYYLVMGVGVLGVVLVSNSQEESAPSGA